MDIQLSPVEIAFRDEVRAFLADKLTDDLRDAQRRTSGTYPELDAARHWQKILHKHGWAAPLWPKEHGGTGWSPSQRFIFEYECAAADAPMVSPFGHRLLGPVLINFGTPEQQTRNLAATAAGDICWCQGFSEPNAGSDLASLKCNAARDGDGYIINGTKIWTTQGHVADKMFALFRTANTEPRHAGISFFIFDLDTPGITCRPIRSLTGQHELNQIFFDDVRLPADALVGPENQGWKIARFLLEFERGAGMFSARHRASFNRLYRVLQALPGGLGRTLRDPYKRMRFAEVGIAVDTFEMLEFGTLCNVPAGQSPGPVASVMKLRSSRLRQEIGQLSMELLGHHAMDASDIDDGLLRDIDLAGVVARDYFEGRAVTIFGGSSEVQLDLIARSVLN